METEFDKEMDALLRQATRSGEITSNTSFASHLDADEISIFAENALPEKAKVRVTKHLADCDRCRTILTNTITLNSEAAGETASSAVSGAEKEIASVSGIPWYRRLFAAQNLAYGLGALALVFAGMLGFLVVQNAFNLGGSEVAKESTSSDTSATSTTDYEGESRQAGPDLSDSNTAADRANANLNESAEDSNGQVDPNASVPNGPQTTDSDGIVLDGKPGRRDRADNDLKMKDKAANADEDDARLKGSDVTAQEESRVGFGERKEKVNKADQYRDVRREQSPPPPPAPAKTTQLPGVVSKPAPKATPRPADDQIVVSGASKAGTESKKRENRSDQSVLSAESSEGEKNAASKKINGKTFTRKGGVWIDSQYRGQKTTTVRRSSSAYKKLDSGLRTTVSKLGGTVVIVWKSKAYRVQ